MKTFYEVWDFETRNMIGSFESESEATALLARLLELNGPDSVRELAILRQEPDAAGGYTPSLLLEGAAFAERQVSRA